MTRTYVKIYGPPVLKAIRALEKTAIDMPTVCIMDSIIAHSYPTFGAFRDVQDTMTYFGSVGPISKDRCDKIISKSGEMLGDYDFFFEWFKEPTMEQLNELLEKIDESLASVGCRYAITTKR